MSNAPNSSTNAPMYKNLYRGKIDFKDTTVGTTYKVVEVNFSGRENMRNAQKARLIRKDKDAGYKPGPGVILEFLEGPMKGKQVIYQAYTLHFFPEEHTWSHISGGRRMTRKVRKQRRS